MSRKLKIIIGLLIITMLVAYYSYFIFNADRPTAKPDLSGDRSIKVGEEFIIIDAEVCTPDLMRIDTFSSSTILEVAGKEFDVCLFNYGPAVHDRNLNQKLPTRCVIPVEREDVKLILQNKGIDFSEIEEFCTNNEEAI